MRSKSKEEGVSPVIGVMLMLVVTIIIAAVVSGFAGDMDLDKTTGPSTVLSSEMDWTITEPTTDGITVTYSAHRYLALDWGGGDWEVLEDFIDNNYESGSISYITDTGDPFGLVFTHEGGDPIDLKELQMSVISNDYCINVDYDTIKAQLGDLYEYEDIPIYEVGDEARNETAPDCILTETITGVTTSGGHELDEIDDLIAEYESSKENTFKGYFTKINPETSDDTIIRTGDQFKFGFDAKKVIPGYGVLGDNHEYGYIAIRAFKSGEEYESTESFGIDVGTGNEWTLSHKPSGQVLGQGDIVYPDVTTLLV